MSCNCGQKDCGGDCRDPKNSVAVVASAGTAYSAAVGVVGVTKKRHAWKLWRR